MALQATSSLCDLEVFAKGIVNIVKKGKLPYRFNFSCGVPGILKRIGTSHFFNYYGEKRPVSRGAGWRATKRASLLELDDAVHVFETYVKQKQQLCSPASHQEQPSDNSDNVEIWKNPRV